MQEPTLSSLNQSKQVRMAHSFPVEPSTHSDIQESGRKLVKNMYSWFLPPDILVQEVSDGAWKSVLQKRDSQVVSGRLSVDHTLRKMGARGWKWSMSFYTRVYRSSYCILLTCFHSTSKELFNNKTYLENAL